jgi:hypothetical protein
MRDLSAGPLNTPCENTPLNFLRVFSEHGYPPPWENTPLGKYPPAKIPPLNFLRVRAENTPSIG